MPDITHLFVNAQADSADATQTQPGDWNDRHAVGVPDTGFLDQADRYVVRGTDRLTLAVTGRLRIFAGAIVGWVGAYAVGSPTIADGFYALQYKEARLQGAARATLIGAGEWFLFDLAPVGRLVLAGRGG